MCLHLFIKEAKGCIILVSNKEMNNNCIIKLKIALVIKKVVKFRFNNCNVIIYFSDRSFFLYLKIYIQNISHVIKLLIAILNKRVYNLITGKIKEYKYVLQNVLLNVL